MKIKICGMRNPKNIKAILDFQPDFMGFIFYNKSPRYVDEHTISTIATIQNQTKTIGVFVNLPSDEVVEIASKCKLDYVQLHGDETIEYVKELHDKNLKIIKAFQIKENFDWEKIAEFAPLVSYFLFDTATKNYGGSGIKFNWNQLKNYKHKAPFFLSGGISINDVEEIRKLPIPELFAIDINSKFETEPGMKDIELIKKMIHKVKA